MEGVSENWGGVKLRYYNITSLQYSNITILGYFYITLLPYNNITISRGEIEKKIFEDQEKLAPGLKLVLALKSECTF